MSDRRSSLFRATSSTSGTLQGEFVEDADGAAVGGGRYPDLVHRTSFSAEDNGGDVVVMEQFGDGFGEAGEPGRGRCEGEEQRQQRGVVDKQDGGSAPAQSGGVPGAEGGGRGVVLVGRGVREVTA
jgi:hypothetical protein